MPTTHLEDRTALARARAVAEAVTDPELPMLSLADLGVLRDVRFEGDVVVVAITPTYSGCPAMATMRDDLRARLAAEGFESEVRVSLSPAWTTDWITQRGRRTLAEHGISPPGPAPDRGPAVLSLSPTRRAIACPRCRSSAVDVVSEYGSTACKALYRCCDCLEPFDHIKEI